MKLLFSFASAFGARLSRGVHGHAPLGKFELNGSRRGLFLHSSLGILGQNIWSNWKILYKQFLEICVFGQFYIYAEQIHESTNIFYIAIYCAFLKTVYL